MFLCLFSLAFPGSLQYQSYRAPGSGWAQRPYPSQANSRDYQVPQADGGGLFHPSVDWCCPVLDCICDPVCQQYRIPRQCKQPSWVSLGYGEKQSWGVAISGHSARPKLGFFHPPDSGEYREILPARSGISFSDNIGMNFRTQTKHLVCNEEENHHEVFLECSFLKAYLSFFPMEGNSTCSQPSAKPKELNWMISC